MQNKKIPQKTTQTIHATDVNNSQHTTTRKHKLTFKQQNQEPTKPTNNKQNSQIHPNTTSNPSKIQTTNQHTTKQNPKQTHQT